MKDAIAFMDWKRVVPWKILSIKARPRHGLVPVGFGSRERKFCDLLEPGSQIWVVTRIAGEFSLVGRVTVKAIIDRDSVPQSKWPREIVDLCEQWKFVARAKLSSSEFFETNCAQTVLDQYDVRFAQNKTIVYHEGSLDDAFRACMTQGRNTVFLSYRWQDGRRFAFSLAKKLRGSGLSPWLDAMAMPRYLAKGDPAVNKARLRTLLRRGIEKSKVAVIINTDGYAASPWTRLELEHIRRISIPCLQVMRGGRVRQCGEPPILQRTADDVAQKVVQFTAIR